MISTLITSQTRIKLLKKFFLNSSTKAHLRGLESEFGESSNSIRIELNRFEKAGLLNSRRDGNKKIYNANEEHPLYRDIHNIILKETGIDSVIEKIINRIGNLISVYLTGDFAHGKDNGNIDLILVGDNLNMQYLDDKVIQAERIAGRKVNCLILNPAEAENQLPGYKPSDLLPLWTSSEHPAVIQ